MIKCGKGEIGNPKFRIGDRVGFNLNTNGMETFFIGTIYIVDSYGTFEQNEEPSYGIMVKDWLGSGEDMLVKHHRESLCFILDEF